jgi:hypothetical protein
MAMGKLRSQEARARSRQPESASKAKLASSVGAVTTSFQT